MKLTRAQWELFQIVKERCYQVDHMVYVPAGKLCEAMGLDFDRDSYPEPDAPEAPPAPKSLPPAAKSPAPPVVVDDSCPVDNLELTPAVRKALLTANLTTARDVRCAPMDLLRAIPKLGPAKLAAVLLVVGRDPEAHEPAPTVEAPPVQVEATMPEAQPAPVVEPAPEDPTPVSAEHAPTSADPAPVAPV